jgi:hypothetical protein
MEGDCLQRLRSWEYLGRQSAEAANIALVCMGTADMHIAPLYRTAESGVTHTNIQYNHNPQIKPQAPV